MVAVMDMAFHNVSTLVAMLPASVQMFRTSPARDAVYWIALGLATVAAALRAGVILAGPWQTSLAANLWVTNAGTLLVFLGCVIVSSTAWRLTPLVVGTLLVLGMAAAVWQSAPGRPLAAGSEAGAWFSIHVLVSVATYALVTLAGVAALAAFLQQRALKQKRRTALTRLLPAVAESDSLVLRLLLAGEVVLAAGLASGMALLYQETGALLELDHKTVLTMAAFVVIAVLLAIHAWTGVRGRQAARGVLCAWLLLTLGYPGVKVVTDVLMA